MGIENSDTTGPNLPWAGKKVDTADVEVELSHLWRLSADNVRISHNINIRTSVLNFVICTQDIEAARWASALIRDLSSTHIARLILLVLDTSSSKAPGVSSWVTLRSFPIVSDLMRHHFEQVTLLLSGDAINSAATIMQPLFKPDLPVYLWWLQDLPGGGPVFSRLADVSSRVIIDSNNFADPEQGISTVSTLIRELPNSGALSDLNWGRITPWRQLVAQFFDSPEYKPYLAGINRIEIEYAVAASDETASGASGQTASPNPIRSWLMAGWLKTSLNWRLVEESPYNLYDPISGTYSWQVSRTTGPLSVEPVSGAHRTGKLGFSGQGSIHIRPHIQTTPDNGALRLIRLTSVVNNHQAVFTIHRKEDNADYVITSVEQTQATLPQRAVGLSTTHEESELLHDELEITGRDYLYESTLHEVFELIT
ncbi:glucose-6-phosphate dehydrogenase assembly protein OpcA [Ktedonosporobacter rubrisoli]|nr:glucose-6-phosphate dehydrogenase assembly protein OpcA [Ktedonosporobacter rubrisoli]